MLSCNSVMFVVVVVVADIVAYDAKQQMLHLYSMKHYKNTNTHTHIGRRVGVRISVFCLRESPDRDVRKTEIQLQST